MVHGFDPQRYEQASTHQREWGARLIAELDLTGSERILDVGSGTGLLTLRLADRVPLGFVLGIDASPTMIIEAGRHERSNLAFQLMDVLESQFYEEFDWIFSNATLHWVTDHRKLLDILYEALKSGGILRANFAAAGNCSTFFRILRELLDAAPLRNAFRDFAWPWYMPTIEAYQELLQAIPFEFVQVWGENADRRFPDAESIVRWIDQLSLVPLRQHVDPQTGDRLRDEVVERMLRETKQADGTFLEEFRRVNVLARK